MGPDHSGGDRASFAKQRSDPRGHAYASPRTAGVGTVISWAIPCEARNRRNSPLVNSVPRSVLIAQGKPKSRIAPSSTPTIEATDSDFTGRLTRVFRLWASATQNSNVDSDFLHPTSQTVEPSRPDIPQQLC
jgi:hypothetical protein